MKGTAANAVQQDCGEKPLAQRRKELQLRLAIKLKCNPNNPASQVMEESWEHSYGSYKKGQEPFLTQVQSYFETSQTLKQVQGPVTSDRPPWHSSHANIDMSLTGKVSKTDNPLLLKSISLDLINNYDNYEHIYTDGSRTEDGKVSSAFCVPSRQVCESYRITDGSSIFAAELIAIQKALKWIQNSQQGNFVIFSDSLFPESIRFICRDHLEP